MRLLYAILGGCLLVFLAFACIGILHGCSPGWNDPPPVVVEPGNPCGRDWSPCANGVCCYDGDICRPGRTAEQTYCVFGGIEPPSWGAKPDAGAAEPAPVYRAVPPERILRGRE